LIFPKHEKVCKIKTPTLFWHTFTEDLGLALKFRYQGKARRAPVGPWKKYAKLAYFCQGLWETGIQISRFLGQLKSLKDFQKVQRVRS
jgi:hypothetical protein